MESHARCSLAKYVAEENSGNSCGKNGFDVELNAPDLRCRLFFGPTSLMCVSYASYFREGLSSTTLTDCNPLEFRSIHADSMFRLWLLETRRFKGNFMLMINRETLINFFPKNRYKITKTSKDIRSLQILSFERWKYLSISTKIRFFHQIITF